MFAHHRASGLRRITLSLCTLELESDPGSLEVGEQGAFPRVCGAIEQQLLDPRVVVEVLEMDELLERKPRMQVDRRTAVQRDRDARRPAQRPDAQQFGDPGA